MRERNVPEKYVKLIQDMYRGCQTKVRSAAGESGSFNVDVGLHQGSEGGMETGITKRVGAGWRNWKNCSGVLCDRRMPVKLKGKVYKTVIRPAMLYGAETWATTKRQEKQIEVTEMRMLRWMCGVTRKDKIRNEHIRGTTRVAQASKKITDRRLNW